MFQIVDDILDVTRSTEEVGKRTRKDEGAGKATFPAVLGLEASRAAVERERARAVAAVAPLGNAAGALVELAEYMAVRTR
jgi:geranylgeranyl pyrophosphate synthase